MTAWTVLLLLGVTLVLVPWLVYPAVIRLLAGGVREPPDADPSNRPSLVSVVIATREAPEQVLARLEDLMGSAWPAEQLELIVAVDGNPAPFADLALTRAPRRLAVVARGSEPGKAAALNAGVAAATGEVLIFADTAQRFAPDAIGALVAALDDPQFGAVSGALELGNEATPSSPIARYWRGERTLRAAEARLHSAIGVTGAIYALRRALWEPLPPGLILDDLWIPMRLVLAGQRVGFEPRAVARDLRTTTAAQEYQRKVRTLTGNVQLLAWMPAVLLPWRNPVWAQFICHKVLRLATPFALALVLVGGMGAVFTRSVASGWWLLGAGATALLGFALLPGATGRRARGALAWGVAMQGAIARATWNGARGRWNVWDR